MPFARHSKCCFHCDDKLNPYTEYIITPGYCYGRTNVKIFPALTKDMLLAANLNSLFTKTSANNNNTAYTSKELVDALRQLHLRALRQEDCVTNSSEERCEEQEWLIQLKDTFLGKIEVLNP